MGFWIRFNLVIYPYDTSGSPSLLQYPTKQMAQMQSSRSIVWNRRLASPVVCMACFPAILLLRRKVSQPVSQPAIQIIALKFACETSNPLSWLQLYGWKPTNHNFRSFFNSSSVKYSTECQFVATPKLKRAFHPMFDPDRHVFLFFLPERFHTSPTIWLSSVDVICSSFSRLVLEVVSGHVGVAKFVIIHLSAAPDLLESCPFMELLFLCLS